MSAPDSSDADGDGEGDGDALDGDSENVGDRDVVSGVAEIVGARANGKHALAITASVITAAPSAARRRTMRLYAAT